jgi:hypothetical protein
LEPQAKWTRRRHCAATEPIIDVVGRNSHEFRYLTDTACPLGCDRRWTVSVRDHSIPCAMTGLNDLACMEGKALEKKGSVRCRAPLERRGQDGN